MCLRSCVFRFGLQPVEKGVDLLLVRAANGEGSISKGNFCGPAFGNVVAVDDEGLVDPHKLSGRQHIFKIFERYPRYEAAAVVQINCGVIAIGFKPFDRITIDMRNGSF